MSAAKTIEIGTTQAGRAAAGLPPGARPHEDKRGDSRHEHAHDRRHGEGEVPGVTVIAGEGDDRAGPDEDQTADREVSASGSNHGEIDPCRRPPSSNAR